MKTLSDFYRLFPSHPAMVGQARSPVSPSTSVRPANDEPLAAIDASPRYRARGYGTGYGRSSGYAQDRTYTAGFGDRMLRVG